MQLKRLKKRKLILKDQITRLESELIPDLKRLSTEQDVKQIFEQLTTPEVMFEVIALIAAALLAAALAHYIKNWLRTLNSRANLARWPRRLVVMGMVLAPSFLTVVLILALRALFDGFDLRVELIDIAHGPGHGDGAGAAGSSCIIRLARTQ